MLHSSKTLKTVVFAFLAVLLFLAVTSSISTVKAQGSANVTLLASTGGSTTPSAGTYTYTAGQTESFSATPISANYAFEYWFLTNTATGTTLSTDNPASFTFSVGTYTLQPYFELLNFSYPLPIPTPPTSQDAIVIVLSAVGGTTSPGPGTYELANASQLKLTATALSGWKFDHWVIGGYPLSHGAYNFTDTPTDNPYNVDHGYGYTYSYQPVFTLTTSPSSSPSTSITPTPTVSEYSAFAVIGVALVLAIVLAGVYAQRRRK